MAVYWIGQDGNVWVQNSDLSASNVGRPVRRVKGGIEAQRASVAGNEIRDPALGRSSGPSSSAPSYSGGSSGGSAAPPPPVLNEAAIRNTQRTIDEIPGLLAAAMRTEGRRYQNAVADFLAQEKAQRKTYGESSTTNQLNYDETFMDSIRAGIKGLGGLVNLLRGTGAAGGTAEDQVEDMVGGVTAKDIRTGADTQEENQTALDNTLSTFLTDLTRKRRVNQDTFENNRRAIRRDSDTQLQDLYGKMAGYYSEADRTAEANTWLDRAGRLTPRIARSSRTHLSKYDTTPVVVKAPELTAFAEPSQPDALLAPEDGQVGSGIFTIGERRRREEAPVGV